LALFCDRRATASGPIAGLPVALRSSIVSSPLRSGLSAAGRCARANEMTGQRRGWRPALTRCRGAAETRQVVVGIGVIEKPDPVQPLCDPLRFSRPEFCKSGFCEFFEHRSPVFLVTSQPSAATFAATAVFLTGHPDATPTALLHSIKHNKVLHESNVILNVVTETCHGSRSPTGSR